MNYSFVNKYSWSYRNFECSELHHSELQLDVFDCEIGKRITICMFQLDLNAVLIFQNLFRYFDISIFLLEDKKKIQ